MIEKTIQDLVEQSPITKTLRDNNSCIIIEVYKDWEVNASMRVNKTIYKFGTMQVIDWEDVEPMITPMIAPDGRKLDVHILPFEEVQVLK